MSYIYFKNNITTTNSKVSKIKSKLSDIFFLEKGPRKQFKRV